MKRVLNFGLDVCLMQQNSPARAVSTKTSKLPSGILGKTRRFPGFMAARNDVLLPAISPRFSIPYSPRRSRPLLSHHGVAGLLG